MKTFFKDFKFRLVLGNIICGIMGRLFLEHFYHILKYVELLLSKAKPYICYKFKKQILFYLKFFAEEIQISMQSIFFWRQKHKTKLPKIC